MHKVDEFAGVWESVLSLLKQQITPYAYKNWFKDNTSLRAVDGATIEIGVPNATYRNVISNKFGDILNRCCNEAFGHPVNINLTSCGTLGQILEDRQRKNLKEIDELKKPAAAISSHTQKGCPSFKRNVKNVSYDDVVIGPSNRIAVSAVESVINGDADAPNPLFIYGESGMGKTHLLQLVYNEIKNRRKAARNVVYTSCESFTNDYITSLRGGQIDLFRNHYRSTDVFLLDDVHFLAGGEKARTKEEFYHTLNELIDGGKQVIITCDKHPHSVKSLGTKLIKRLMGGMWVQLGQPCRDTRLAILNASCAKERTDVPSDVIDYIADQYYTDLRELTGALTTVIRHCTYAGEDCRLELVQDVLGCNDSKEKKVHAGFNDIINEVSTFFDIPKSMILSDSRSRPVVNARHIAVYLCNKYVDNFSLGELALIFNNSRPAILYAGNKITRALKDNDPIIKPAVQRISSLIEARF